MVHGIRSFRGRSLLCCLLLIGGTLTLTGCGGGGGRTASAEQAQISGSVKTGGKPVKVDTEVVFESSEKGAMATGKVDALGNFSLRPGDPAVGIPPGRYAVSFMTPSGPPVPVNSEDYKKKMMMGGNTVAPPAPSEIPVKLQSAATSPLKLEVKAGPNTFDIELTQFQE